MISSPTIRVRQRVAAPCAAKALGAPEAAGAPPPDIAITPQPIAALRPAARSARRRGKGQVERIAANIARFGVVAPILVTGSNEIIDGHAVLEACRRAGLERVPTVVIDHLDPDEVRALRLSLNRLAELSSWDSEHLAAELTHLLAVDPDLTAFTGFSMPEIDVALAAATVASAGADAADVVPDPRPVAVSRAGDLWQFAGGHRLLCGNARAGASYAALLGGRRVRKVAADPPYGCAIRGHVSATHGEFVEGSGMDGAQARAFFAGFLAALVPHLADGAIVETFIDWRGMHPLVTAAQEAGLTQLTTCVWDKGVGGMGSLYRQQVEFVLIFKHGRAGHTNNVSLGRHGRNRTTLWSAPGLNQFGRGRRQALALHPTVKPVGLIADALLDTSARGDLILDPFCGSGTTLLAAHRTGRVGQGIELDPVYVDVAVRRMEAFTGKPARLTGTDLTFAEAAERRASEDRGADAASLVSA